KLFFFINLLRISVHSDWDFFAGRDLLLKLLLKIVITSWLEKI
ncbi:hypothetical protein SMU50_06701, partial [Streptococcus mutans 5SM3]